MKTLLILALVIVTSAMATVADKSLPEFYTTDMDNNPVALSDYLGKGPVVVSFWASDCDPCKEEQVYLNKIYKKYKDDGLEVLAVSTDSTKTLSDVKKHIKSNNYKFTVLLDVDGNVATSCAVPATPYTFLLDETGKVIHEKMGFRKGDEKVLEEEIVEYFEEMKEVESKIIELEESDNSSTTEASE